MIVKALAGEPLPVYGNGANIRDWLFVEDHVRALERVFESGVPGQTYNVGGNCERRNIDVVQTVCDILDRIHPRDDGRAYSMQITFVDDRPGHDQRYAIDAGKISDELGWTPKETFESGIEKTVMWYLGNRDWWETILSGAEAVKRRGLGVR